MLFTAVSALSHDGLIRDHNEDSVVVGAWTTCAATTLTPQTLFFPLDGGPVVAAVADGLGGHAAGELASSLAVCRLARSCPTLTDPAAVREVLGACDAELYAEAALDPERAGMGSTVAGVVVMQTEVIVFNVGDSRVYHFADGRLVQLSTDDSEPAVPGHGRSAVLSQCLGGGLDPETMQPHVSSRPLAGPTRYLLCTDGLTDTVDDAAISAILREHDGGRAVFQLWKASIEAGAPDNVTAVLVEIAADDPR